MGELWAEAEAVDKVGAVIRKRQVVIDDAAGGVIVCDGGDDYSTSSSCDHLSTEKRRQISVSLLGQGATAIARFCHAIDANP